MRSKTPCATERLSSRVLPTEVESFKPREGAKYNIRATVLVDLVGKNFHFRWCKAQLPLPPPYLQMAAIAHDVIQAEAKKIMLQKC